MPIKQRARVLGLVARAAWLTRYSPGFHTLAAVIEARKYELLTVVAVGDDAGIGGVADVFRRERGATGEVCQHPGRHLVEHHHPDHGRLRGCGAGNRPRPDNRRVDSNSGHRILRPARGHPGVKFLGKYNTAGSTKPESAPTAAKRYTSDGRDDRIPTGPE